MRDDFAQLNQTKSKRGIVIATVEDGNRKDQRCARWIIALLRCCVGVPSHHGNCGSVRSIASISSCSPHQSAPSSTTRPENRMHLIHPSVNHQPLSDLIISSSRSMLSSSRNRLCCSRLLTMNVVGVHPHPITSLWMGEEEGRGKRLNQCRVNE